MYPPEQNEFLSEFFMIMLRKLFLLFNFSSNKLFPNFSSIHPFPAESVLRISSKRRYRSTRPTETEAILRKFAIKVALNARASADFIGSSSGSKLMILHFSFLELNPIDCEFVSLRPNIDMYQSVTSSSSAFAQDQLTASAAVG